jgi:hypothetical protein
MNWILEMVKNTYMKSISIGPKFMSNLFHIPEIKTKVFHNILDS